MDLFGIMINQICFFITAITVGFLAVKCGVINSSHVDSFAKIILGIIFPLLVITLIVSSGTREELFSMLPFLIGVVVMFAVLIIAAFVSAKVLRYKKPLANTHVCSSVFVNSALLGYPIIMEMFPEEAGLSIAAFLVVETVIIWTVGVGILTAGAGGGRIDLKKMITPVTIALFAAIIMLLFDIHPKGVVWDSLCGIGETNKYMGLVYIGADIGRKGFKTLFKNPKVFLVLPIKLILGPLAVFFTLRELNFITYNQVIIITVFAMLPSMMVITMLAQQYDCCPEYASGALLSNNLGKSFDNARNILAGILCFLRRFGDDGTYSGPYRADGNTCCAYFNGFFGAENKAFG